MPKDDWVYVGHMLDMGKKALAFTEGLDRLDYDADETLRIALTHLIQVMGEAAQRISNEFRQSYPEIQWHEIAGMRNRIVHDYLNVDEDVIWEVVSQDLQSLVTSLERIAPPET
jgi:uncharacterized protein with HEPN domain